MADTLRARKARGAFFTPPEMADVLANWAIREGGERVLDPSAGEGAFLSAAARRFERLGRSSGGLSGIELDAQSAKRARTALIESACPVHIRTTDFFDIPAAPAYDVILGNPPYIRYQGFFGTARAKAQRAALAQGVKLLGLANSWAPFVVHASAFLKPGGRLGLVLPAELLAVNYAALVREFLLSRFSRVEVVLFDEKVFPGVMEEVVLLLAEGQGANSSLFVRRARSLEDLKDQTATSYTPPSPGARWTSALLSQTDASLLDELAVPGMFSPLSDWGSPRLGAVTGNNQYFALSAADVAEAGLTKEELVPISPAGSRHLRGLTFTHRAWKDLVTSGFRAFLFRPGQDVLSSAARRYIVKGERKGVHRAYKCRVREPWWRVPIGSPPDLFITYMNHDFPRLATNAAGVVALNSVHGFDLHRTKKRVGRDLLPLALFNSATLLSAELEGRSYGGGILKLEPREARNLLVPSSDLISSTHSELKAIQPQLGTYLRQGDTQSILTLVDRVVLRHGAGLAYDQVKQLRLTRETLFGRRRHRGGQ